MLSNADRITCCPALMATLLRTRVCQFCQPLVCGIALHTMIVGQPYRLRMLREALQHIVSHPQKDKVWFTRPGAIYDHCAALPKGTMVPPPA